MRGLENTAPRGSAYFWGTVTGIAVAVPLMGAVFGAVALAAPSVATVQTHATQTVNPPAVLQSLAINRAAKTARLEVRKPVASETASSTVVKAEAIPAAAPPVRARALRTPKGCLSAIGVTKSNLATEELTVCVADISTINSIN